MDDKLIVIGRFTTATEAHLAMNRLEEAGIQASINGAAVSSLFPSITGLHGVEILVREDDAFRASCVLAPDPDVVANPDDAIQVPSQITAPGPKHGEEDEEEEDADDSAELLIPIENTRELAAHHAYLGAIIGIGLWPWQLYVTWLLLKVFLANDEMKPEFRRQAQIAGLINAPFVLLLCLGLRYLVGNLSN